VYTYLCLPDTADPRAEGRGAMIWRSPYFDLASGLFVPEIIVWDPETR
jgi:hypothetical protein